MQVTLLGTGTGLPDKRRAPSGLLVQVTSRPESDDRTALLLDSGSGTIGRLLAAGVEPALLDYLYYTHAHTDHTADLVPLLQAMDLAGRSRDLHLTASSAFWPFLDGLLAVQPWAKPARYELLRHAAESEPFSGPGWQVSSAPTHHTPHSRGYRIQEATGKVLVYSGDAAFCPELIELARGADVLILECSYPDEYGAAHPDHLTPMLAGRIAAEAGAKHLVLTHFYPVCEEAVIRSQAEKVVSGPLTLAQDGTQIAV